MGELTEERLTALLSGDAEISSVNETQAEEGDKDEKKAETAKVKEAETNEKEKGRR